MNRNVPININFNNIIYTKAEFMHFFFHIICIDKHYINTYLPSKFYDVNKIIQISLYRKH